MMSLPEGTEESLCLYADHGVPLGSCLEAAVANDFLEFFKRADVEHTAAAQAIASFIYNKMPSECHGSRAVVRAWVALTQAIRTEDPSAIERCSVALNEAHRRKGEGR
jgi:hypothetical protein